MTQDNRRSFRISEPVYFQYEHLTDEEFGDGMDVRNIRKGNSDGAMAKLADIDARLSEAMFLMNAENSAVGRCIKLLHDKLNLAIEQSRGFRATKESLAKSKPQVCDISADGIVFSSAVPLSIGDKLYVQFLLSTDSRYIESFCTVVRLTEPPDSGNPQLVHGIAVEFVDITPGQREILIQHMFSRESETLRMRRLEMDAVTDAVTLTDQSA